MRRLRTILITAVLLLLFAGAAYADGATEIATAEDLAKIAENPGGTYILTRDIDLAGVDWTPFAFTGNLNGDGHTISNLTVTKPGAETRETVDGNLKVYETRFAGLFSVLENASVKDLKLIGVRIALNEEIRDAAGNATGENRTGVYAGGLAGYAAESTILRCRVTGTVSVRTNAKANGTGGVIGFAKASAVDSCGVNATLILTDMDRSVLDENFLGGAYAAGYGSVMNSRILLDAYDSCHGYVHSGGLVGMYYPYGYSYDAAPASSFTGNTVAGAIHFFEDTPSRRAYCEATIGEIMNWNIVRERNTTKEFVRDEVFSYDVDLSPETVSRAVEPNYTSFTEYAAGSSVTVSAPGAGTIAGLYCVFWEAPESFTISGADPIGTFSTTSALTVSPESRTQFYLSLSDMPFVRSDEITITFDRPAKVCGIYAVPERDLAPSGALPGWVHDWKAPCEKADVLLFSTHADDEQLFFAGILPYYAAVRGLDVQVTYMTDHIWDLRRHHERLNGLWEVGIRHYPTSLGVPDAYAESIEGALANANASGVTEEGIIASVRETLDRFEPKVVVTHDEAGEYGHGQHMLLTSCLEKALADGWAEGRPYLQRVFLHLYETDPVTLSFLDTPFDELGGKTPFQITQNGFRHHESQMWTWFRRWIYGTNGEITLASQIDTYSPLSYGQYYGKGYEAVRESGDFFAGLTSNGEERAEIERLEREAREAEEAARLEAEKNAGTEEDERIREEARKHERTLRGIALGVSAAVALGVLFLILSGRKKGKH